MNQEQAEAIEKAIKWEKRAYDLYISLSRKSPNRNLQILFNTLALEELKHEALLKEAVSGGNLQKAIEKARARNDDFTITDKISPSIDLQGFREAMELAIGKEQNARERYIDMTNNTEDIMLKGVFRFLAGEEERHEMIIREELAKL